MTGRRLIGLLALLFITAAATFQLKYSVVQLERQIDRISTRIADTAQDIRTLQADITFRTRPERIVPLAAKLGMVPLDVGRLTTLAQLPEHAAAVASDRLVPVLLPSGIQVPVRLKPLSLQAVRP